VRPGHHRPLGTTTTMRFPDWPRDHPTQPRLGDVAREQSGPDARDEDAVRRAYLVVGIIETATGYRLLMERVGYETLPDSLDRLWAYSKTKR
jgi:hypothetical protein